MARRPITDHETLKAWLISQPPAVCVAMASRTALRVLPVALRGNRSIGSRLLPKWTNALFRSNSISWAGGKNLSKRRLWSSATEAAESVVSVIANAAPNSEVSVAAYAAANSAYAAAHAVSNTAAYRTFTASAARDADMAARAEIWSEIDADARYVDVGEVVDNLLARPLWQDKPEWFNVAWREAQSRLSSMGIGFEIWIEWYQRRVDGNALSFSFHDGAAEDRFHDHLLSSSDRWWKRPAAEVNAEIAGWVEELSAPTGPVESDPQQSTAPALIIGPAHPVVIDRRAGQEGLLNDQGAINRHAVARAAFAQVAERFRGNNNAGQLSEAADKVLAALTDSVTTIEPSLLVLHAETYRQVLAAQQAPEAGDNHLPLSAMAVIEPRVAQRACDLLIGSDPFLEAMDARQFGPDRERVTADSADGIELANAMHGDGLTDQETDAALREAASNAEGRSPESRQRSFLTDFGLNVVRHANSLVFQHIERLPAFVPEGLGHGLNMVEAGFVAGGGMATMWFAWAVARNIKKNEAVWRKFAGSVGVTKHNFDRLIAMLEELPLE